MGHILKHIHAILTGDRLLGPEPLGERQTWPPLSPDRIFLLVYSTNPYRVSLSIVILLSTPGDQYLVMVNLYTNRIREQLQTRHVKIDDCPNAPVIFFLLFKKKTLPIIEQILPSSSFPPNLYKFSLKLVAHAEWHAKFSSLKSSQQFLSGLKISQVLLGALSSVTPPTT